MFKKTLVAVLIGVLCIVCCACSSNVPVPDETPTQNDTTTLASTEETTAAETATETTAATTATTETSPSMREDFKAAMDQYETFMDDYVEFMKKYNNNPTDLSLLTDYATFMKDYADLTDAFSDWEDEDLSNEELNYYIEVQTRVTQKLLEVTA